MLDDSGWILPPFAVRNCDAAAAVPSVKKNLKTISFELMVVEAIEWIPFFFFLFFGFVHFVSAASRIHSCVHSIVSISIWNRIKNQ